MVCVAVEGLIATPPREIVDGLNDFVSIPNTPLDWLKIYPYIVYARDGIYIVISDEFSILPTEFRVSKGGETYTIYFSAGRVEGTLVKTALDKIDFGKGWTPKEFKGVIIASSIRADDPITASVQEINSDPAKYAFKWVRLKADYLVATAALEYNEDLRLPMGIGILADEFSDFFDRTGGRGSSG